MRTRLTVRPRRGDHDLGGIGTLNELTVAYELKPTVILEGSVGWSSRIREDRLRVKHLEEAKIAELHFAQTPQEAVDMAFALAGGGQAAATRPSSIV